MNINIRAHTGISKVDLDFDTTAYSQRSEKGSGTDRCPGITQCTDVFQNILVQLSKSSSTPTCTLAFRAARYLDLNNQTVLSPTPYFLHALALPFSAAYFPIAARSLRINVDVYFLFSTS